MRVHFLWKGPVDVRAGSTLGTWNSWRNNARCGARAPIAKGARPGHVAPVTVTSTLVLLGLALAMTGFSAWRGARPPDLTKGPRMAPWRLLMLLGAGVSLLLLVHLVNLLGVQTGR